MNSDPISALQEPSLQPLFSRAELAGTESAWWGHVPFATWLITFLRPRVLVELGTHSGVSYTAFCEAIVREQLGTRCFAVDTWRGDEHAGFYGDQIFETYRKFHDQRYNAFSTLIRTTFDEALENFLDGSIDLLHIDGLHTYEAVKHDFETWFPKLSDRSVILLHDIEERQGNFGVWKLWNELIPNFPHFQFLHSWGLGLLVVGQHVPQIVRDLCGLHSAEAISIIRGRFAFVGERWTGRMREDQLSAKLQLAEKDNVASLTELSSLRQQLEQATQACRQAAAKLDAEHARRAEAEATAQNWKRDAEQAATDLESLRTLHSQQAQHASSEADRRRRSELELRRLRHELDGLRSARDAMCSSVSWRATAPFRWLSARLRPGATNSLADRSSESELLEDARIIAQSNLFDADWYLRENPDVGAAGANPIEHYLRCGAEEGRNPGPNFDAQFYLQSYPDVAGTNTNPLIHYLKYGASEGRRIRPIPETKPRER